MTTDPSSQPDTLNAAARAQIDASIGGPVLLFFGTAIFWLLFGSALEVLSAIKLVWPGLLDGISFLSYGRTTQAATASLAYGWATPAAIGIGLWLTARLCRVPLQHHKLLVSAGLIWNAGVMVGACSILAGNSTSLPLLGFPAYSTPILVLAYAFIAIWAIITFHQRKPGPLFVSQWFLVAGFLCFPWLFTTANALLVWNPVAAPAQAPVAFWFANGFFNLWLVPIGLAAAFYIIPKGIDRPINSHHLSLLGFWTLILFGAWTGTSQLIGGPLPAWLVSVGVVASVMMLIPAAAILANLHLTLSGHYAPVGWSPALRFIVVGICSLATFWITSALMAFPSVNAATNFSDINRGLLLLGHYGFFAMTAFGSIYYIVPRLTGKEWQCPTLIVWHFWLSAVGLLLGAGGLLLGGLIQGFALQEVIVTFRSSLEFARPFRVLAIVGSILTFAAALSFAALFAGILLAGRSRKSPALLAAREENSQEPVAV